MIVFALLLFSALTPAPERTNSHFPSVDLRETVRPSALAPLDRGGVRITGRVGNAGQKSVLVRVTNSSGASVHAIFPVKDGVFKAEYPKGFPGAPEWKPCVLFVDATTGLVFNAADPKNRPAEITLLVYDRRRHLIPDYPSAFTTDLRDRQGRRDMAAREWPATRALVNLYMRSYGAHLAGVGRADFDLSHPGDLLYFRNSLALYDFDHRDRDWTSPLGNRVARTFWKSVWSTWFNASNDQPLDHDPANAAHANYRPYAFTNDFADILIEHLMRRGLSNSTEDNLDEMCREGIENLLACQHREAANFALTDTRGRRETYTAGAFRYGLFINGDYMTEGKGWFYNPAFRDYADGGNLNGRAMWAIGEALRRESSRTQQAASLRSALALGVRFCLQDALLTGYAKRTPQGNVYWRDAGEHAYLTQGLVNGCAVAPDLIVLRPEGSPPISLRTACVNALNALVDLEQSHGQWAVFPNVDSVAISALAEGALVLKSHPDAARWRAAAVKAADGWINAQADPKEFRGPTVHFGLRLTPATMTYRWAKLDPASWQDHNYLFFYQTGHWIEALSRLYALTGDSRYRKRAEAMVAYLCGDNPWGVRLLNELGGVYNWVEDRDGDGIEDTLKQDMYPESTAFTLIGLYHLLRAE